MTTINTYKGDALELNFQVKVDGAVVDITGWEIAAEIFDGDSHSLRKATANVPGGADTQILITTPTVGRFSVFVLKDETLPFQDNSDIEVANISGGSKQTLFRGQLKLASAKIDWTTIP